MNYCQPLILTFILTNSVISCNVSFVISICFRISMLCVPTSVTAPSRKFIFWICLILMSPLLTHTLNCLAFWHPRILSSYIDFQEWLFHLDTKRKLFFFFKDSWRWRLLNMEESGTSVNTVLLVSLLLWLLSNQVADPDPPAKCSPWRTSLLLGFSCSIYALSLHESDPNKKGVSLPCLARCC